MSTANWPVLLVLCKREGREFSMFMSKNGCTMVDLFDKAVAEGAR